MSTMLVFVPGAVSEQARYQPLLDRLVADQPSCVVRAWNRPISIFTKTWLTERAEDLRGQIENWLYDLSEAGTPITDIIVMGHSIGGLVAREAFLQDLENASAWAPQVRRIVLLATPNRGVDPKKQPLRIKIAMRAAGWAFTNRRVWKQSLRGSAFVTNLRIRWIRTFNRPGFDAPHVVQLRVEGDPVVQIDDSRDIEQFPRAGEAVVSGSTHANIASLEGPDDAVAQRLSVMHRALFGTPILTDPPPVPEHNEVALVVHGIRASKNDWPAQVEQALETASPGLLAYRPSYGYLPAFDFAVPLLRRSRRRWIRDTYSDLVAKHPNATFHYVGHSNGTYLFSKLIETAPGARFESAYLGGCVLDRGYQWQTKLGDSASASVGRVLNVRATSDVPVGWLCSALRGVGMRELGTAGLDGFDNDHVGPVEPYCLIGGHGAGFGTVGATDRIAAWVAHGEIVAPPNDIVGEPKGWFRLVSRLVGNPMPLLVTAAFVAGGLLASPWLYVGAAAAFLVYLLKVL